MLRNDYLMIKAAARYYDYDSLVNGFATSRAAAEKAGDELLALRYQFQEDAANKIRDAYNKRGFFSRLFDSRSVDDLKNEAIVNGDNKYLPELQKRLKKMNKKLPASAGSFGSFLAKNKNPLIMAGIAAAGIGMGGLGAVLNRRRYAPRPVMAVQPADANVQV